MSTPIYDQLVSELGDPFSPHTSPEPVKLPPAEPQAPTQELEVIKAGERPLPGQVVQD